VTRRRGFTLVEVVVALTVLAVGLLGAVGTLLAAQRALLSAERLHLAGQAGAGVADSLLAERAAGAGRLDAEWGALRWSADDGGVRIIAEDPAGATLLEWWFPGPSP
jgi:prepilin-type N-terminal cleavage/methylation domain-containing protein